MELSTLRLWLYTVMKVRAGRLLRIDGAMEYTKHPARFQDLKRSDLPWTTSACMPTWRDDPPTH